MSFVTIIELLVKMAFMISLGYFLRRRNIITEEVQTGLSDILLIAVLPLSVLSSSAHAFDPETFNALLFVGAASFCFYGIGLLAMRFLSKRLPIESREQRVFATMTVFANTGFVGIPIMTELFGKPGLLMAVVYNMMYNLFMYTFGLGILSGRRKIDIRRILLNPVTIASVVALGIFVSPFRIPEILMQPVEAVGGMSVPLSMIIMGTSLVRVSFRDLIRDGYAFLASMIRLMVFPLIMLGVMLLIRPDPVTASVVVLMTGLPCGTMNVIFAEKFDCAPAFASRAVMQSTVLMAGTIVFWSFINSILLT